MSDLAFSLLWYLVLATSFVAVWGGAAFLVVSGVVLPVTEAS